MFMGWSIFDLQVSILSKALKANSEDPDEMIQNVAFHLGLHHLL